MFDEHFKCPRQRAMQEACQKYKALTMKGIFVCSASIKGNKMYKVVIYQEGMLGSLLLGASKVNPVRFSEFLNEQAAQGWRVRTMEKDIRRMLLFFRREAYVVILEKAA
jgi:hypothetical protein